MYRKCINEHPGRDCIGNPMLQRRPTTAAGMGFMAPVTEWRWHLRDKDANMATHSVTSKVWHHVMIWICLIFPELPGDSLMSQSDWVIPHVYLSACNRNAGANAWLCCHFVTPSKTCSTFVLWCLSAVQFSSASACLATASLAKVSVVNIWILPLPWSLDEVGCPKHWVQSLKRQHTCFVKHNAVQLQIETPRANLATQSRFTPLEWLLIARKSACFYCCLHTQSAKAKWLRCSHKQPRTGPPRDQCLRTETKWLKWLKSRPMKPDLSVNPALPMPTWGHTINVLMRHLPTLGRHTSVDGIANAKQWDNVIQNVKLKSHM